LLNDVTNSEVNAGMPGKKLVRHQHFYRQSAEPVRHRHSGIRVSGTAGLTLLSNAKLNKVQVLYMYLYSYCIFNLKFI
jgi:hypothetical protein